MPIPHCVTKEFFCKNEKRNYSIPEMDESSNDINILTMLLGLLFNVSRNRDEPRRNSIVSYSIIELPSDRTDDHSALVVIENRISRRPHRRDSTTESSASDHNVHLSTNANHEVNFADLIF